jgi:endonuclease III-like uncharacterized protein
MAGQSVAKLRRVAAVAMDTHVADAGSLREMPLTAARKALMRFPSIGESGADKILLFTRTHLRFALESNGLRVMSKLTGWMWLTFSFA